MNEADTRAEYIDRQLADAGWVTDPARRVKVRREYAINAGEIRNSGMRTGRMKADYILEYKHTKLAIIEAKSKMLDVSEGVAQAKLYAEKLRLGVSFAANGRAIYQINHLTGTEGEIDSFPSPDELWHHIYGGGDAGWLDAFCDIPFEYMNGDRQPRYYQEVAVNRAVAAIAEGKDRVLLALATGTGKTFIAFQIAWKLFKSRWTLQGDGKRQPRILFLADRNILADQAITAFGVFDKAALVRIRPEHIAKRGEVPKNGSVFFTIFQSFMSGQDEQPYYRQYEPDFFDLIILDECHRGGANDESRWRDILKYFSEAVHLGLTATPRREVNKHTYAYFGEPVFTYSLKEGIKDGFLTPFKVKRIQTNIDDYTLSPDDEIIEGTVEAGRVYDEGDFNRIIVIRDREQFRVKMLLDAINRDEKTIIFCANQVHAAMVRDIINQLSEHANVDYCVRVTANDGIIGDTYLNQFKDNDKTIPTILTTSHKLSTGVDARNVRNIVLMRKINSMIEFKQIIGRGTRLFEGKNFFTIMDFVNAYHLFNDAEWDGEAEVEFINDGDDASEAEQAAGDNKAGDSQEIHDSEADDKPDKPMLRIRLGDGKLRELQSMSNSYFFVDGRPISAEDYLKRMFNVLKLPEILQSEAQLRSMWANPVTRRELLEKLEAAGCYKDDLKKFQALIQPKDSDLFDVLEYIAYARQPISREARVRTRRDNIHNLLNAAQRDFIDTVLRNYIEVGVDELDDSKLDIMLRAKYGSVDQAQKILGAPEDIRQTFIDFQRELYA